MTFLQIFYQYNFGLLSIGITIIATGILGFIVFLNNRKSATNQAFFSLSLVAIFYLVVNYLSYQAFSETLTLWSLRLVIFFATWYSFFVLHLSYVFPDEKVEFSKWYKFILIPLVILVSLLTLTPAVFPGIQTMAPVGQVSPAQEGPGIVFFGIMIVYLVGAGIFLLAKKTIRSKSIEKMQIRFLLAGSIITYSLLILFNFVLPVVFYNLLFIPFAPVFIFPFIVFTFYAIIKHRLFNVRVIATEVGVFLLLLVLIIEFINAQGLGQQIVSGIVLASAFVIGLVLIRSVLQEVKQREQIEILNLQLQKSVAELQKIDEMKTEFVSLASHQLRTPLTPIKGFSDMLRSGDIEGELKPQQKDAVEKIYISAQHMVDLIDDILDISKLEKEGGFNYQFQIDNPQAIIEKSVQDFQPQAQAKGLKLSFSASLNPYVKIKFDPIKLSEAIGNILSDSIKYTPEGNVWVKLHEDEDEVIISIKDTGVGIDQDDIPKIFQKFFRTKVVARLSTEGTGLGLYFTRRVIEDHEGHVWVESPGLQKGSEFTVKLPKLKEPEMTVHKTDTPAKSASLPSSPPPPTQPANL